MPSDTERREVARRLRDRLKTDGIGGFTSGEFGNAVYFSVMHGRCGGYGEAGAFLADLIEPSCDRDALLKLADDLYERGNHIWELSPEMQRAFANMMYKALGVNND